MSYCKWADSSDLAKVYHDQEWGIPIHDDRRQFEFLMLEAMQCGLSWNIILKKRKVISSCFDDFDYTKISKYTSDDIQRIMNTPEMIKSKRKIQAVINNAGLFMKIIEEYGTFSKYIWNYSEGKTIIYEKHNEGYIPASNSLSDKISKDLKKRGFKFLGSVTVYSHLQACGIICDHGKTCSCYKKIIKNFPTVLKKRCDEKNVVFYE